MATLTIQATGGSTAWMDSNAVDTARGGSQLFLGEEASGTQITRSIQKFDLSSIPAGSVINSAVMTLKYDGSDDASSTTTVNVYRILRTPVYAQATWNSYSTGNAWGTAGCANTSTDRENVDIGDAPTQSASPSAGDDLVFNLTASKIQEMIPGGTFTNNGFLIKDTTENATFVGYYGSSTGTSTNRPKLVVEYTLPSAAFFMFF